MLYPTIMLLISLALMLFIIYLNLFYDLIFILIFRFRRIYYKKYLWAVTCSNIFFSL